MFVFSKQGILSANTIKYWFFIFLVITTFQFELYENRSFVTAIEIGSAQEEFTNNTGYRFLSLFPLLFFFNKKPLLQYLGLLYITYFIVSSMKRGAIIIGIICFVWFLVRTLKITRRRTKLFAITLSLIAVFIIGKYVVKLYQTSEFFQYRIEQTEAGYTSQRDILYADMINYYLYKTSSLQALFGSGAWSTLRVSSNFAHNDWLEIAVNQGLLGLIIYSIYWGSFFSFWRKFKHWDGPYSILGMCFFIYFLKTFFSMSYDSMTIYTAISIGYCAALQSNSNNNAI